VISAITLVQELIAPAGLIMGAAHLVRKATLGGIVILHADNMKKGFTLIELMTAVSIFTIVMVISMGSILGVFDADRKSRTLKTIMNNLNLAIESMSKEMRYGKNYHCGASGTLAEPQNCPSGDTLMSFLSSEGTQITYRLEGNAIEKQIGSEDFLAITASDVVIDSLDFYTLGAGTGNSLQPKVIIKIEGHVGSDKSRSDFTLQTLSSQRALDI
jgi:prepilin-type N-terminal cleavage/methylation domain-containing protein